MLPRAQTSTLQEATNDLATGTGTNLIKLISAKQGRSVDYIRSIEIKCSEQYVTVSRFNMGVLSGVIIGAGLISIVYVAVGGININNKNNYLLNEGLFSIACLLMGIFFGGSFGMVFNRRPLRCSTNHMKNGIPIQGASRSGAACLDPTDCTTLDERKLTAQEREIHISGRCAPAARGRFRTFFQYFIFIGSLISSFIIIGVSYANASKIPASTLITFTFFGIFIGWVISFIFS